MKKKEKSYSYWQGKDKLPPRDCPYRRRQSRLMISLAQKKAHLQKLLNEE